MSYICKMSKRNWEIETDFVGLVIVLFVVGSAIAMEIKMERKKNWRFS